MYIYIQCELKKHNIDLEIEYIIKLINSTTIEGVIWKLESRVPSDSTYYANYSSSPSRLNRILAKISVNKSRKIAFLLLARQSPT